MKARELFKTGKMLDHDAVPSAPEAQDMAPLLRMQRTAGNQSTLRFLRSNSPGTRDVRGASGILQAKLKVGGHDDPQEHEAEHVAEQVTNGEHCACEGKEQPCNKCASQKNLQRMASDSIASSGVGEAPPVVGEALRSPGRALDGATRAYMEPHFGHSFTDVRVHTDALAAESARSVGALAYTVGRDVVFDSGRYAPETSAGRRLLAHELSHVVQQGSANVLRRAVPPVPAALPGVMPVPGASDFMIDRVGSSTQSEIFFARNSDSLTAAAVTQITAFKTTKPGAVKLIGYASGDEAAPLAKKRADAVKTELGKLPNAVTVLTSTGNASARKDSSDFSQARSVEILAPKAASTKLDCAKKVGGKLVNPPKAPCPAMDPATWTEFNNTHPIAVDAMSRATKAVAGVPSAADAKVIDEFFGKHDPATLSTLQTNLGKLEKHVGDLPKITQCGGQCDTGGCDEGPIAYNSGVDSVPPGSTMTLCVPTFKSLNQNDRARNLIHESAHGTDPLGGAANKGTEDVAYRHERMMFELKTADRLRNSDSYALFAMVLRERQLTKVATALPAGISTPAKDTRVGFVKAGEEPAVKLALARLEKRLTWAADWMSQVYGSAINVKNGKDTWASAWGDDVMNEAAKRFPLTAAPAKPTSADQTRLAGIVDRYKRMKQATKTALTVTRMVAGIAKWSMAPGNWVAPASLEIGPDFFLLRRTIKCHCCWNNWRRPPRMWSRRSSRHTLHWRSGFTTRIRNCDQTSRGYNGARLYSTKMKKLVQFDEVALPVAAETAARLVALGDELRVLVNVAEKGYTAQMRVTRNRQVRMLAPLPLMVGGACGCEDGMIVTGSDEQGEPLIAAIADDGIVSWLTKLEGEMPLRWPIRDVERRQGLRGRLNMA